MINAIQFHFLEEKIYDISTALFFSKSDAVLKYPTCIIRILKVDEIGQLWFLTPRPKQNVNEFERAFITAMHFFRKGKNFYLEIEGKAFMVNDPEEINCLSDLPEDMKKAVRGEAVLFKVKLMNVLYFESRKTSALPATQRIKESIYKRFFRQKPGFRPVKLQPAHLAY